MRFSRAFALVLVSSSMPSLPYGNGAAVQVLLPAIGISGTIPGHGDVDLQVDGRDAMRRAGAKTARLRHGGA